MSNKHTSEANLVLEIEGKDFRFNTSSRDISNFVNAVSQKNKVAPGYNLLISTVHENDQAALKALLCDLENVPKSTIVNAVLEAVMEVVEPEVTIAVKKHKK